MNKLEHNTVDHRVIRTRLYARLLQVNGPTYLDGLFPLLKRKLDATLHRELQNGRISDGIRVHAMYGLCFADCTQMVFQYLSPQPRVD